MSKIFETKNLIIKPPSFDDFDELYQLLSDEDVMRYIGNGVRSREEVQTQLEKMIQHYDKHGFSLCYIYDKESKIFVGCAGLIYLAFDDAQPEIELAFALHKKFWQKGYATELAKYFMQWAFSHGGISSIVAVTKPNNEGSRRVLEKIGMCYLGKCNYKDIEAAKYILRKKEVNFDDIKLIPATLEDYPIIQNLARFYAYDIAEHYGHVKGWEMEDDGLYGVGLDYKRYWESKDTFPFLVRYQNELAGFVIVDKNGSDETIEFNMAQFFILRLYKSRGLGKYIATLCFDKFPGIWEVMVMPENENAYRFWRNVIKSYTHNQFVEYTKGIERFNNESRNLFKFSSINVDDKA